MINDPLKYVAVPYAELQALLEMARNVSKNSPWGQSDTQPWNPEIKQLAELGDEVPTIAGVIGESNTVLISMPDFEAIKQLMPVIGINNNWWVNGIDTGVSAVPDNTKVLRPPMLIRFPAITATANQDEILISGGVVTVYNGTDSVLEVLIPDTVVNVYNKPMVVIDYQGNVVAKDYTDPVVTAVPICYPRHVVHGIVDVVNNVVLTISATELAYYIQTLRDIKLADVDSLNKIIQEGINTVNTLITVVEEQAATKLLNVPRVLSFCHFNDYSYELGMVTAYYRADHNYKFPANFVGSCATFRIRSPYVTLPEVGLLGIYVNNNKIGAVQFNVDNTSTFIMYQDAYQIIQGDLIEFKVEAMTYIGSFSLTLVHELVN